MLPQVPHNGDPAAAAQFFLAAGAALAGMVPIGAVSILAVQRAVSMGFWRAFLPTLGATAADGIFGVVAGLGSGFLSASIFGNRLWLRLVGSVILAVIGLRLLTDKRGIRPDAGGSIGLLHVGLLKMTLVLSNPLTLGFYVAAFSALGLESPRLLSVNSLVLGGGVVFGNLAWFLTLCAAASRFHLKLSGETLHRIRAGVGGLLIVLGFVTAVSALI